MNDLQLLAQLAMMWMTAKGGNVQSAIDIAEEVLESIIGRENRHAKMHMSEPQTESCYHCRMIVMAKERQQRAQMAPGPQDPGRGIIQ